MKGKLPQTPSSSKRKHLMQHLICSPTTDKEVVSKLKKGDIIPIPIGAVSWWFNNGDSELIIAFLGETSRAHVPGQFTYFFLTGTQGITGGFSSEVLTKSYNLTNKEAEKLTESQQGVLIVKLKKGQHKIPEPQMDKTKEMVFNIDAAKSDNNDGVENEGLVTTLTESEFPFLGQVGLSVMRVKLEPNSLKPPMYLTNPVVQVLYVARGSGNIEIVGLNGESVLDPRVEAGHLIVVLKFFVSAEITCEHGMEFYSILTTKRLMFEELAGKSSIWKAMSPQVLEVALNVDSDFVKFFLSHLDHTTNLLPPYN